MSRQLVAAFFLVLFVRARLFIGGLLQDDLDYGSTPGKISVVLQGHSYALLIVDYFFITETAVANCNKLVPNMDQNGTGNCRITFNPKICYRNETHPESETVTSGCDQMSIHDTEIDRSVLSTNVSATGHPYNKLGCIARAVNEDIDMDGHANPRWSSPADSCFAWAIKDITPEKRKKIDRGYFEIFISTIHNSNLHKPGDRRLMLKSNQYLAHQAFHLAPRHLHLAFMNERCDMSTPRFCTNIQMRFGIFTEDADSDRETAIFLRPRVALYNK